MNASFSAKSMSRSENVSLNRVARIVFNKNLYLQRVQATKRRLQPKKGQRRYPKKMKMRKRQLMRSRKMIKTMKPMTISKAERKTDQESIGVQ
jgi:hypothetical protein